MPELRELPVDDPVSQNLLADYFAMRREAFPGGTYTTAFPPSGTFDAPGAFLVAYDGATAVGCGGIRPIAEGPRGPRFEVKHLYLSPVTRGRGWGRLLLAELIRHARDAGGAEVVLDTHHSLEAAAGLYAGVGFAPIGPYNDNPNATRWYGLRL